MQFPSHPLDDKMWRRKQDPHTTNVEVEDEEEEEDEDGREELLSNEGIELKEIRNPKSFACRQPTVPDTGYVSELL